MENLSCLDHPSQQCDVSTRKLVGFWTPQGYEKPSSDPLNHCLPDQPLNAFQKENFPHAIYSMARGNWVYTEFWNQANKNI